MDEAPRRQVVARTGPTGATEKIERASCAYALQKKLENPDQFYQYITTQT